MFPDSPWSNHAAHNLAFGSDAVNETVVDQEAHIDEGCAGVTSSHTHKHHYSVKHKNYTG